MRRMRASRSSSAGLVRAARGHVARWAGGERREGWGVRHPQGASLATGRERLARKHRAVD
jgi:hypothetical protein